MRLVFTCRRNLGSSPGCSTSWLGTETPGSQHPAEPSAGHSGSWLAQRHQQVPEQDLGNAAVLVAPRKLWIRCRDMNPAQPLSTPRWASSCTQPRAPPLDPSPPPHLVPLRPNSNPAGGLSRTPGSVEAEASQLCQQRALWREIRWMGRGADSSVQTGKDPRRGRHRKGERPFLGICNENSMLCKMWLPVHRPTQPRTTSRAA